MSAEVATVAARVQAEAVGFEDMQRAITRTLADIAKTVQQSLSKIPEAVAASVAQAARQTERETRRHADEIVRLREQLADEEARQTMEAADYRIRILQREGERRHALIAEQVRDHNEAGRLMMQNAANVEREITRIQEQEAARREAADVRRRNEQRAQLSGALAGTVGVAAVGAAGVGAAITDQKKVATDFDANMRDVNSIAKMTEEQLGKTGQAILNIGRTIPKTAIDMSAGLYDLESSGFGVLKGGLSVLEQAAKAATAGKATTGEAVQVLAGTLNAYGLTAESAGRVSDALFKTIEAGVVTFPEMAKGLGNVTATANLAEVNIENVGAAIALMTSKNIPAAQSFTALNSLMLKLITPTEQQTKVAKAMGIEWLNVAEAGEHIKKVGFAKALQEIADATKGDAGKLKLLVEDTEAFKAASILAANGGRDFAEALREVNASAGSTDAAFKEQMKSFKNQQALFDNAVERMKIGLGSGILQAVNPLAQGLAGLIDMFTRLPGPVQAVVGVIELLTFAALAATGALAAFGLASMGFSAIGPAFAAIKAAALGAIPSIMAFGASTWAAIAPLLPIIGAVTLIVAALAAAWYLNLGGIRDFAGEAFKRIEMIFQSGANTIMAIWGQIEPYFAVVWEGVKKVFFVALAAVDVYLRAVFAFWGKVIHAFALFFTGQWERLWDLFTKNATTGLEGAARAIEKGFKGIGSFIGDTVSDIGELLGAMWEGLTNPANAQGALSVMEAALARIKSRFTNAAYDVAVSFEKFADYGGDILASAGKAPTAPKTGKPSQDARKAPSAGGGGRLLTEDAVKKDIEGMMLRLKAHKMTTEEAIKQLENYKQKNQLTGDQALLVDAKVAELRDGLAKKSAAARKQEAAQVAAEKRKELADNHTRVVAAFNAIERAQKAHVEKTAAARLKALTDERAALQALIAGANEADRERLKNRIAAIDGETSTIRQAQGDATKQIAQELEASRNQIEGDSLTKRLEANRKHFENLRALAVKNSLGVVSINAQEVEAANAIRKKAAEDLETFLDGQGEDSLGKSLARVEKQFKAEREKYKGQSDALLKLAAAEESAAEAVRAQWRLKTFQGWKQTTSDILGTLDVFADQTRTVWAKVQAIGTLAIGAFEQRFADALVPSALTAFKQVGDAATGAVARMAVAVVTGGTPALAALIAGWVGAGVAAVQAGLAAAGAWVAALGPIGWVIAGVVALTAAVAALWAVFNRKPEQLGDEVIAEIAKIDAGLLKNREARIKAERDLALKALEVELQDRKKQGANDTEIQAVRAARQREIYAKGNEDLAQLDRDRYDAYLDGLEAQYKAAGDLQGERNVRMMREDLDMQADLTAAVEAGLLSQEAAQRAYLDRRKAMLTKYAAEEAAERDRAMQDQVELTGQGEEALMRAIRARLDEQLALGQISSDEHARQVAKVVDQEAKGAYARLAIELAHYEQELQRADTTAARKIELQKRVNETTAKMQQQATEGMQAQLEAYKKSIESKYQAIADKIGEVKKALEDSRDAELRSHKDRLRELDAEAKATQRQIDLIDEQIAATKRKYDEQRKQVNTSDKTDFNGALAAVDLTAGEMTYDAIEAQRKSAENRFALEEITQDEFLRLSTEAALKKAALAKRELDDERVTFEERTRIQGYLVEAYKAFQDARIEAIDLAEERENAEREKQLAKHEEELVRIEGKRKAEEAAVDAIETRYQKLFQAQDDALKANQKAWDAANKAIREGTDENVKAMVGYWGQVHNQINRAIGLAATLATFGFGNFGMAMPALPRPLFAASGGLFAGGTPGKDSIPAMVMPGELLVSNPLTQGLERMIKGFDSLMRSGDAAGRFLGGAGGGLVIAPVVHFHDPVVRTDADLDRLADLAAEKASYKVARELQ
jgi:TP901 family phage tail tape measure protein